MYIRKNFGIRGLISFSGHHIIWLTVWAVGYASIYEFLNLKWFVIPWVPLAVIGTAVAFYVGFKNNSAYDRMWEARKIWGAIVNNSRTWGANVIALVNNQFTSEEYREDELSRNPPPASSTGTLPGCTPCAVSCSSQQIGNMFVRVLALADTTSGA